MIFFKFNYNKKIGKNNKGLILSRHKEKGTKSLYVPIDLNYFNHINSNNGYIQLLTLTTNYMYRNTSLILGLFMFNNSAKEYRYLLKPKKQSTGHFIKFCDKFNKTYGDISNIDNFDINDILYNLEFKPNMPSKICMAAECVSIILKKKKNYTKIKLPSNHRKTINDKCYAVFGHPEKITLPISHKAGTQRLLGNRPKVRGSAMNACDHPHGGGEGKAPIGKKSTYSFTGKKTKGIKTVKKNESYK